MQLPADTCIIETGLVVVRSIDIWQVIDTMDWLGSELHNYLMVSIK